MKQLLVILFITAILTTIFIAIPGIDIYVAGLFYVPGRKFFLDNNLFLTAIHQSITYITISLSLLFITLFAIAMIRKKIFLGLSKIRILFLIIVLILGPGLLVNVIFKEHFGRARPHHLEIFGGTKEFSPAFYISNQCEGNCSFVSGDVSIGFYFLAIALAVKQYRKPFAYMGIWFGILFSFARIAQGAHFLSDVIFSGIFTYLVAYSCYLIMLKIETRLE